MQKKRRSLLKAGAGFVFFGIGACSSKKPQPFVMKSLIPPNPKHCFDIVKHMPEATPFVFGGTCFCTPTETLMETYHANGHLQDMQLDDLLREYDELGIKLTTKEHQNCNNLCQWGPHLLKGGKCMVSPTAGTLNFEDIRYGMRYIKKSDTQT